MMEDWETKEKNDGIGFADSQDGYVINCFVLLLLEQIVTQSMNPNANEYCLRAVISISEQEQDKL